jgi:DNA-binding MarR family transcriptional regulator
MTDDPNVNPIAVASLIASIGPRLQRWAEHAMEAAPPSGRLTWRQVEVLQIATRQPDATHGFLATELDVTPAVVTGLVDRLERDGLVRRRSNRSDRRVIHVAVTEAGARALADAERHLTGRIARSVMQLAQDDQAVLRRTVELLLAADEYRCPHCHAPAQTTDRFCAICGRPLGG